MTDTFIVECNKNLLKRIKDRWHAAKRIITRFHNNNRQWLAEKECVPNSLCCGDVAEASFSGRPALPFSEKGRRAKLMATEELRRSSSREELVFSAASKVHVAGRRDAAKFLEEVGSPRRGPALMAQTKARASLEHRNFSADEALALVIDLDLTRAAYRSMHRAAKDHGCNLYPSSRKVSEAKLRCMPPTETLFVEPHLAQVPLQQLLHHTAARLLELQTEVLAQLERQEMTLICKWGMDGSSGHSRYKQMGVEQDEFVFVTTLVPLELRNDQQIVWRNSTPSSPRLSTNTDHLHEGNRGAHPAGDRAGGSGDRTIAASAEGRGNGSLPVNYDYGK